MKAKCFVCSVTMCECVSRLCDDCSEHENPVCDSCLADAKLGRMVRGMPGKPEFSLAHVGDVWWVTIWENYGDDTPEAALEAAGVKEGE